MGSLLLSCELRGSTHKTLFSKQDVMVCFYFFSLKPQNNSWSERCGWRNVYALCQRIMQKITRFLTAKKRAATFSLSRESEKYLPNPNKQWSDFSILSPFMIWIKPSISGFRSLCFPFLLSELLMNQDHLLSLYSVSLRVCLKLVPS